MRLSDPKELEKIIDELDELLIKGFLLQKDWFHIYNTEKSKQGDKFNEENFILDTHNVLNKWYEKVITILDTKFSEKYHLYHFMGAKGPSYGYPSVPQGLANLKNTAERHLSSLEEIILRLEERRNLAVRQEIANKEYDADVLYEITYSEHSREVKLNKILLTKPDFDSENDRFFMYVFTNPGRPIGIKELTQKMGNVPKKRLAHIVRDLGFVGEIQKVFFPVVSKDQIKFVNPITKQYFHKHGLPPINFTKIVRQSKVK